MLLRQIILERVVTINLILGDYTYNLQIVNKIFSTI